jgi:hypothetical protein
VLWAGESLIDANTEGLGHVSEVISDVPFEAALDWPSEALGVTFQQVHKYERAKTAVFVMQRMSGQCNKIGNVAP